MASTIRLVLPAAVHPTLLAGAVVLLARDQRFTNDARVTGCAPIPVSSRRTDRYRLDHGGNRQLNHAIAATTR